MGPPRRRLGIGRPRHPQEDPVPKSSERELHPQEFEIPEELPIIPLVSTIVFPNIVVNLQVVRKRNLQLVRDLASEGIVGLVIQRGSGLDFPPVEDLTQIGVAARLVTRINVSRNTIQIILLGLARFKVVSFTHTEPYLKAKVECIEEPDVESMEANVLMGNALHPVSYTHLRAHETPEHLVCRL